jgi:hypothetical protein
MWDDQQQLRRKRWQFPVLLDATTNADAANTNAANAISNAACRVETF